MYETVDRYISEWIIRVFEIVIQDAIRGVQNGLGAGGTTGMKVVLFCGGAGMRLRGYVDDVPKPMVQIGSRPLLWHLMKYYAHFGHKDFILCLGYKGNIIKDYFLNYDESVSNDFVWSKGGKQIEYNNRDIHD